MCFYTDDYCAININEVIPFLAGDIWDGFTSEWGECFTLSAKTVVEKECLKFQWEDNRKINEQYIYLQITTLTYGDRLWWICPVCSKRCGVLYGYVEGWGCRQCGGLKYRSSHSYTKVDRLVHQLKKIRNKSECPIYCDFWTDPLLPSEKPKWMRDETWKRYVNKHRKMATELKVIMDKRINNPENPVGYLGLL